MKLFLSKRKAILIVAVLTLILAIYYTFLRENEEIPNYENPSSIVESYSKARLYAETDLVIACIVPEKRSEPMLKQFAGGVHKDSHYSIKILNVELNGNKGNVTYHATLKWGEPLNTAEELNETAPVVKVDGKWYIDREEAW
ncbi:hypothetical protein PaecuDRAFT_0885 [Paenibacillus curdlanolyticus YK9]|uniref:DUF4878 domain-containing protein n=1 Tax=Paenibacillus curdlanolyticus YK9 TaxID=717606 RepID=E0I5G3_9BACL|nr:hypothetical protein [Paenibacillus curdlanolyticus]EFM12205.1 hypothetical protein PaecuDRAFT_0885 [Paenibacillus curdlanolyticus YK9]